MPVSASRKFLAICSPPGGILWFSPASQISLAKQNHPTTGRAWCSGSTGATDRPTAEPGARPPGPEFRNPLPQCIRLIGTSKQTERKREKGRQAQYRSTQNRTAESRGRVPPKPIRRGVPAQRSRHQESASALPTPSYPHPTPHTALSSSVQFRTAQTTIIDPPAGV